MVEKILGVKLGMMFPLTYTEKKMAGGKQSMVCTKTALLDNQSLAFLGSVP